MGRTLAVLCLWGVGLAGCDAEPPPAPVGAIPSMVSVSPEVTAHRVSWEGETFRIHGLGTLGAYGRFETETRVPEGEDFRLFVSLHDFPNTSKAWLGQQAISTDNEPTAVEKVDFIGKLRADLPLKTANNGRVDLGVSLDLELSDGERLTIEAPPQPIAHVAARQLLTVKNGPVAFVGDANASNPLDTVAVVDGDHVARSFRVLGSGHTLGDLDWIAVEGTPPDARSIACGGGWCGQVFYDFDTALTLYDRRSGTVVAKGVVRVEPSCAPTADAMREKVDAWVMDQLGRRQRRTRNAARGIGSAL